MDRYSSFKAVSQTLHAYSQNIPFPGGLALESTARLILVVTAFMEMKETEKQDRQRSKRLLQRGVDISHLILCHDQELRRDQASSSFIVRFMSTIAAIDAFVSEISRSALARKGIRRYLTVAWIAANGNESRKVSKQQFDDYSRELDSLHLDFQSHLSSVRAARGPHQLIKHPDIQLFWKYRLTNALEVPWNHFWCHFLDEYPVLKRTFLGQEGQKMKHIFEKLANSSKIEGVSPQELDQIFQPRNESVDRIVDAFLQNELGSNEPTDCQDIASLGEVQQWKGYWVRDSYKGIMNLEICVSKKHQVFGSGVDEIERFTLEDVYPSNICEWQRIESITGILDVWHAEMGEEIYRLNQQNKKEVYFYNKFYECPVASQVYGRLLHIPLPSFQSQEWEVPCTQTVESIRMKIVADIKNNMKVTFGSKRVHLKWLVPFNVFVDLFQRCQEVKKTRTMFTVAKCPESFLQILFGASCLKKEISTGKEVVQAIFDTSSTTFKYIIKSLELHVTFSFRRFKREGTVWREMEHAGVEASMISTSVFLDNTALEEIQLERSWTLLDVRRLLQGSGCYPENFLFFHLNKVIRKRRENSFSVQELLGNNQDSLNLYISSN